MSFMDFYNSIASTDLMAVAQHWNEARGPGLMPVWKDINPMRITAQLPIVWSYTYDSQTDAFTGRLSGDVIDFAFGGNLRGKPMSELYPESAFPRLFARSKRVITQPAFFRGYGMVFRHLDRVSTGERIIMPFAPSATVGGGIFGATSYPYGTPKGMHEAYFKEEIETWFSI